MAMNHEYAETEPARAEVNRLAGATMLEFGAPWCGYCQAAQELLSTAIAGQSEDVRHIKIEDGKGRPLGRSFRVTLWPTLIFLKDGVEVERLVRPGSADAIRSALAKITPGR